MKLGVVSFALVLLAIVRLSASASIIERRGIISTLGSGLGGLLGGGTATGTGGSAGGLLSGLGGLLGGGTPTGTGTAAGAGGAAGTGGATGSLSTQGKLDAAGKVVGGILDGLHSIVDSLHKDPHSGADTHHIAAQKGAIHAIYEHFGILG